MLPKEYRLPKNRIREVFALTRAHQRIFIREFALYFLPGGEISRFAIIVPLKAAGSAVKRNRIKRLIRHALISLLPKTNAHIDGIILVRAKDTPPTQQLMTTAISNLLAKIV